MFGLRPSKPIWAILGTYCSISVVFCMTFPFSDTSGFIYDLRGIPLLIAVLYGGYRAGLISLSVLLGYRYWIGGDGFEASLVSYLPAFVLAVLLFKKFNSSGMTVRIFIGAGLMAATGLLVAGSSRLMLGDGWSSERSLFFVYYVGIVTISIALVVMIVEMMRENIRMRSEIQNTERIQVLGELAASIAHEVRNPLTVVKGFVQLLRNRIEDDTGRQYTEYALSELDRAEVILSDYLSYAKPHAERVERIQVDRHLLNLINIMDSFVKSKGHSFVHELEPNVVIQGDSRKFSQVLINIIKNASEAMPRSGTVRITASASGSYAVIKVSDTGKGMTRAEMSQLGKPYYSTKQQGTGLGLVVCYRIVEAWNGKIEVESEVGKGTTFAVYLPLVDEH